MKVFHKKGKGSIVMMVVLAMLLQIVGPVAQTVYATMDDAFQIVDERLEDGAAYIDWEFTLDQDNKVDLFTHTGKFTLEEAVEDEDLVADDEDKTVIGT